jgi:hypothetical protein
VELEFVLQVGNAPEAMLGIFKGNAPYNAVYFIPFVEKKLRKIRAILSRDACDECLFCHKILQSFLLFKNMAHGAFVPMQQLMRNTNVSQAESSGLAIGLLLFCMHLF